MPNPTKTNSEQVEVIKITGRDMCLMANGVLLCRCGECKPEEYKLPKDYKNLIK